MMTYSFCYTNVTNKTQNSGGLTQQSLISHLFSSDVEQMTPQDSCPYLPVCPSRTTLLITTCQVLVAKSHHVTQSSCKSPLTFFFSKSESEQHAYQMLQCYHFILFMIAITIVGIYSNHQPTATHTLSQQSVSLLGWRDQKGHEWLQSTHSSRQSMVRMMQSSSQRADEVLLMEKRERKGKRSKN